MKRMDLSVLFVTFVFAFGAGFGCDGSGDNAREQSNGEGVDKQQKLRNDQQGPSGPSEPNSSGGGSADNVFASAKVLADKVEAIFEAYAFGGDHVKALGEWEQGEDEEQMSTDRIQFGNGVTARDIESFEVLVVTMQVGHLGGHMKDHVFEASILTDTEPPKIANGFRLDEGKRLHPMPLFPENAPHIEGLATDVTGALADSERCRSLPIASVAEIKKQLPATGAQSSALEGEGKVAGRFDAFCDEIEAFEGDFEFGVRSMLVVGQDKQGEYAAQVAFAPGTNDDDQYTVKTWPDRLHDRR